MRLRSSINVLVSADDLPSRWEAKMEVSAERLRPNTVRQIAVWWQDQLDNANRQNTPAPESPSLLEVMDKFNCSEEEALRGVCLGEYRHFGGVE